MDLYIPITTDFLIVLSLCLAEMKFYFSFLVGLLKLPYREKPEVTRSLWDTGTWLFDRGKVYLFSALCTVITNDGVQQCLH